MKKSIKYIVLLSVICVLGLSSCKNEDPDIFGESSAQRINKALITYNEALCSSESGWAMEYFPNENEQGVTFLMRFDKNTAVDIASKNTWTKNKMEQESSFFEMIADNGPVLSFNTYNTLFHFFSNPEDIGETPDNENGRGFLGDYEFIVMKAEQDLITLKGKKRGLDIFLRRLPIGQSWSEYYAKLDDVDKSLFSTKMPKLIFSAGGEKYTVTNAAKHIMFFVPEGGDPISQTIKVPLIITQTGIRFVKPFEGHNKAFSIQSFTIAEDGSLVGVEDNKATITAPALAELIKAAGYTWRINKNDLGGNFASVYNKVVAESKSALNRVFQYFEFKVDAKTSKNTLSFRNGTSNGLIYVDINSVSDSKSKISFASDFQGDNNGNVHMEKCPSYKEFVELLVSSEFEISSGSAICPTTMKLTSVTNPNDYIIVDVQ